MKRRYQKRSSLFLIEMIISIAFFALASTVCVQFFAESRLTALRTARNSQVLLLVQSAEAAVAASDGTTESFLEAFPDGTLESEDVCRMLYDEEFQPIREIPESGGYYTMRAVFDRSDDAMLTVTVTVSETGAMPDSKRAEEELKQVVLRQHLPYAAGARG